MNTLIKVLDHGLVRLVSYMQPAVHSDAVHGPNGETSERWYHDMSDWTGDLEIVRAARTSYDAAWRAGENEGDDAKLIAYLMKNRHTSPFEMMEFTFEVRLPIFAVRQWHRHRMWNYSEQSARYTQLPEIFYVPLLDQITTQSKSNKQMRTVEQHPQASLIQELITQACEDAFRVYRQLIEMGCPRELARSVLPMGTYTHMFAKVDLHNLFHFCGLRLHTHAQYEIRVYAQAMLDLVRQVCPVAVANFERFVLGLDVPMPVQTTPTGTVVTGVAKGMRKHF